jgi:hypothetical protein
MSEHIPDTMVLIVHDDLFREAIQKKADEIGSTPNTLVEHILSTIVELRLLDRFIDGTIRDEFAEGE